MGLGYPEGVKKYVLIESYTTDKTLKQLEKEFEVPSGTISRWRSEDEGKIIKVIEKMNNKHLHILIETKNELEKTKKKCQKISDENKELRKENSILKETIKIM